MFVVCKADAIACSRFPSAKGEKKRIRVCSAIPGFALKNGQDLELREQRKFDCSSDGRENDCRLSR